MAKGYFSLVLHAHLPFVRHPEDPTVMEEQWLYEAITGTYLPLLQVFEGLLADGIPYRTTVSLSAPLLTMLTDDLLKERYAGHMDALIELAGKELVRTRPEPHYQRLAQMYWDRFHSLRNTWRAHDGDLVRAFRRLQEAGRVEVITSTATHGFFPMLNGHWPSFRAQVHTAADLYEEHLGQRPKGMWLGECGYVPGVDEILREAAIRYFIVDSHALLLGDRQPVHGVHAPVYTPSGVAAFARDTQSSEQVWSAKEGYPGDPQYRDFYRDIGFDLPMDYIGPHVHPEGIRMYTGIKYHAITHGQLHDKWVYDPDAARARAGMHASHFRGNRQRQVEGLAAHMDRPPMILSPYDAELYGHWWYEGPVFLNDVYRQLHFDQDTVETLTPGDYLDRHPTNQLVTPSLSSWGAKGYASHWCNETNAWTYRHLHVAADRMVELARRNPNATGLERRALDQAARELLLAQSSDWSFIMTTGTTVPYATRRFNEHVVQFDELYRGLKAGRLDERRIADLESRNNIFPRIDYRIYAT